MDGIVFDFDGVLADTMGQHAEAYRQVLAPLGVPVEDREVFLREGARSETILRDLLEAAGKTPDDAGVQALADEKQRVFRSLGTPGLYPGAEEVVETACGSTDLVGLVTGTRRENLDAFIPHLLPAFAAVLAQADYTHDKPHPEPYAKAAEALGLDPSRCIAVENAVRGVQSARNAGYGTVIAISTTLTAKDLAESGADVLVGDHATLRDSLRDILTGPPQP